MGHICTAKSEGWVSALKNNETQNMHRMTDGITNDLPAYLPASAGFIIQKRDSADLHISTSRGFADVPARLAIFNSSHHSQHSSDTGRWRTIGLGVVAAQQDDNICHVFIVAGEKVKSMLLCRRN